jgi:hypothetical protein
LHIEIQYTLNNNPDENQQKNIEINRISIDAAGIDSNGHSILQEKG